VFDDTGKNDFSNERDGIRSYGLIAAANALKDLGKAVIVAPSVQKSGVGRSLSLFEPVRVSGVRIKEHERMQSPEHLLMRCS
jgi:5'/3'-nucleotidase SurE